MTVAAQSTLRMIADDHVHTPRPSHGLQWLMRALPLKPRKLGELSKGLLASVVDDRMKLQESVFFRRSEHLPGIEVLDAVQTDRNWKWLNTGFAMAAPSSWVGEVHYRGRRQASEHGTLFCSAPGEIHSTPRVYRPGSFTVLILDPTAFSDLCAENGRSGNRREWKEIVARGSPMLLARLERLFLVLRTGDATSMQLQSKLCEVFEAMADELLEGSVVSPSSLGSGIAEAAREALHSMGGSNLSLNELSQVLGLSRFQTLRAFKRRYGVPPHAYQLCYKIANARTLLSQGWSTAAVAMECGFADQSHFGRHFRRLTGTTPAQYAANARGKLGPQFAGRSTDFVADVLMRGDRRMRRAGR